MAARNLLKCMTCSMFRPGRVWDNHQQCPQCRSCSRKSPCEVCIGFSTDQWKEIDTWITGQRRKLQKRLDRLPTPDPMAVPGAEVSIEMEEGEVGEERVPPSEPSCSERASGSQLVPAEPGVDMAKGKKKRKSNPSKGKTPLKKKTGPEGLGEAAEGSSVSVPGMGTEAEGGSEREKLPEPRPGRSRNRTKSRSRSRSRSRSPRRGRSRRRQLSSSDSDSG